MNERGLGRLLQSARQRAGLTQQQLCQQANLSFSTLTKIERGAIKAPSIFTVQAIAEALSVSLDDLIGVKPAGPLKEVKQSKSGISFIFFDVNGCLVHFYQRAFARLAADSGVAPDLVETAFWHFNDEVCRGEVSLADFNSALADRIGVSEVDWQSYYLAAIKPVQQMDELLKWVEKHYQVGLLTNIMPGFLSALRRHHLIPDISYDAVVDSSEVGVIKPEPEIYRLAADKAGCPAENILLVDDSRANLRAAEKQAWKVLWFNDSKPQEAVERIKQSLVY